MSASWGTMEFFKSKHMKSRKKQKPKQEDETEFQLKRVKCEQRLREFDIPVLRQHSNHQQQHPMNTATNQWRL